MMWMRRKTLTMEMIRNLTILDLKYVIRETN